MTNTNNKNAANNEQGVAKTDTNFVMLYDFTQEGKGNWRVEDDVVMGGRSASKLEMTADSFAHFTGRVSLENNGGFCSIHQVVEDDPYVIDEGKTAFVLHLKTDGKKYNFRVNTPNGRHAYAHSFATTGGDWETITVPFDQMEATYHGEPVAVPNYKGEKVIEMQLLIGNEKEETFDITIASIGVK